jgi:hypothetical protein
VWDEEKGKWYVAIVDVVAALTESPNPQVYWRVLKKRLLAEGNQTVTNCNGLKMEAPDGKMRLTDVADVEQIFRLIQSIPSPKAEPFKLWLAEIARERLDEMEDPEQGIDRINIEATQPKTLTDNRRIAARGGSIVGNTRKEIEANIGKSIVTPLNAKTLDSLPESTNE